MKIYTTVILNTEANPYAPDRMDCMTFKTLDSAVEHLIDWMSDEGFIMDYEIPEVEKCLRNDHIYRAASNARDCLIVENEFCNW